MRYSAVQYSTVVRPIVSHTTFASASASASASPLVFVHDGKVGADKLTCWISKMLMFVGYVGKWLDE